MPEQPLPPKVQGTYTFDSEVKSDFDKLCEDHSYNKSGIIQTLVRKWTAQTKTLLGVE